LSQISKFNNFFSSITILIKLETVVEHHDAYVYFKFYQNRNVRKKVMNVRILTNVKSMGENSTFGSNNF
jgi:hypothetical protein